MSITAVMKDRDYYRGQTTEALIEEVKRGVRVNWQEVSVVLIERLYDTRDSFYDGMTPTYCPHCDNEL